MNSRCFQYAARGEKMREKIKSISFHCLQMFLLFLCCVSSWFKHKKKIAFHVLFFIMGILENRKIKAASKLGQYSVSGLLLSGEVAFCLNLRRGEKLE